MAVSPWLVAAAAWVVTLRLAWAFLSDEIAFTLVAENSRGDAPWYYRLAALWGNAPGSLILFAAITTTIGAIGTRRHQAGAMAVGITGGVLLGLGLMVRWPFATPDIPAVRGFGMTPILEHPAMAIHPPLLYCGLAACLVPYARGLGRSAHRLQPDPAGSAGASPRARLDWRSLAAADPDLAATAVRETVDDGTRRWVLGAFGLITVAMLLGGWWSYAEQGWGGYWAWDPVENGSLAPWLALLIVIHRPRRGTRLFAALPWCVALAGAAVARSGAVRSVHTFAEAPAVGWSLAALAALCAAAAGWSTHATSGLLPTPRPPGAADIRGQADTRNTQVDSDSGMWRAFPQWLAAGMLAVVVVGVGAPLVASGIGERRLHVGGDFFARLALPIAAGAVLVLALLRWRHRRLVPTSGWWAHLGFVALVAGVIGSTFGDAAAVSLSTGATVASPAGPATLVAIDVQAGPRVNTDQVVATIDVDGIVMSPALVAYPERGGILAETDLAWRPWRDVQAVLLDARDDGSVLVEIRTKPLVSLVWLGALITAAATLLAGRGGPGSVRRQS